MGERERERKNDKASLPPPKRVMLFLRNGVARAIIANAPREKEEEKRKLGPPRR